MDKFKDKVIIITGASEGIGRALSLSLSSQKPKLVLAARNNERLMQLKEEAEPKGSKGLMVFQPIQLMRPASMRCLDFSTPYELN